MEQPVGLTNLPPPPALVSPPLSRLPLRRPPSPSPLLPPFGVCACVINSGESRCTPSSLYFWKRHPSSYSASFLLKFSPLIDTTACFVFFFLCHSPLHLCKRDSVQLGRTGLLRPPPPLSCLPFSSVVSPLRRWLRRGPVPLCECEPASARVVVALRTSLFLCLLLECAPDLSFSCALSRCLVKLVFLLRSRR